MLPFSLNVATSIWLFVVDWTRESFFCCTFVANCRRLMTRIVRNNDERHWLWHCLTMKWTDGTIIFRKTKNGYFRKLSSFIGFFFILIKTKTDMECVVVVKKI
jgi:hypothetical protein